jgi:esterase/lipase
MDTLTNLTPVVVGGFNTTEVISTILAIFVVVQTIVRLTPTKRDDEIMNPIFKILDMIFNRTNLVCEKERRVKELIVEKTINDLIESNPQIINSINRTSENIINKIESNGGAIRQIAESVHCGAVKVIEDKVKTSLKRKNIFTKIGDLFRK